MEKYSPGRTFYLLQKRLRCVFAGKELGSCNLRPGATQNAFSRVCELGVKIKARRIFAPMPGFTNNIQHIDDVVKTQPAFRAAGVGLVRTASECDGGMVGDLETALMFAPADCPTVIALDPNSPWWFMGHMGLDGLLPHDTVLDIAVKNAPAKPDKLLLFAGFGIGPCCFGYHYGHGKVLAAMERYESIVQGVVKHGPREGQTALQLTNAIRENAFDCGFRPENMQFLETCTACYGAQNGTGGVFYSNTYDGRKGGPLGGRNCLMAIRVRQ